MPMFWPYPLLIIDRSYVKGSRGATESRIEIRDPDPEKLCDLIRGIAAVLTPPEATWYVVPANPYRGGRYSKTLT